MCAKFHSFIIKGTIISLICWAIRRELTYCIPKHYSIPINNNNNIYTGGVLTLSGFRNGPVKKYYKEVLHNLKKCTISK